MFEPSALAEWKFQQERRFKDQKQREEEAAQAPLWGEAGQRRVEQATKLHQELHAAHQQRERESAQQRATLRQHDPSDEWSILMQNAPQQQPQAASSQHSTHFAPQQQQSGSTPSEQWSNGTQNPLQQQQDTSSHWSHGTQMAPQEQQFAPQNATSLGTHFASQGSHSSGSYNPSG